MEKLSFISMNSDWFRCCFMLLSSLKDSNNRISSRFMEEKLLTLNINFYKNENTHL